MAENDFGQRTKFCEYARVQSNRNNNFIANILFSEEVTFYFNGHVNLQNNRDWFYEIPHRMQDYHAQGPQKINVWAGIV